MNNINFKTTKKDASIIDVITDRTYVWFEKHNHKIDFLSLQMDIISVHLNDRPLRLAELLDADDFNFMHDISGIINNIDRKTGKLTNLFCPRYAK